MIGHTAIAMVIAMVLSSCASNGGWRDKDTLNRTPLRSFKLKVHRKPGPNLIPIPQVDIDASELWVKKVRYQIGRLDKDCGGFLSPIHMDFHWRPFDEKGITDYVHIDEVALEKIYHQTLVEAAEWYIAHCRGVRGEE